MANTANLVLKELTVSSNPITEYAVMNAPGRKIYARGRKGDTSEAYLKVPSRVLVAGSGASAKLTAPDRSYSLSGSVTVVGRMEHARGFAGSVTATGLAGSIASAELEGIGRSMLGYGGAFAKLLKRPGSTTGSGTVGSVGTMSIYMPDHTLTGSGTVGSYGSALISAPTGKSLWGISREMVVPGSVLVASGTAVVTATYKGYAINTKTNAITEYDNHPFDFVVRFQGKYYGCNSSGMFLLEGADDSGSNISASAVLHPNDLGSRHQKRLTHVYLGSRQGATEQMTVSAAPDEGTYRSALTTRQGRNRRAQLPRGVVGRYWSLKLENVNGGALDIDSIDVVTQVLRRKL